MKRISEIRGKKIYSESEHIGKATDVVINPEKGEITYLIKGKISSLPNKDLKEAREFIRENIIPFEKVRSIKDIIVVRE